MDTLNFLLLGDGYCAELLCRSIGLSTPGMSMIVFSALFSALIFMTFRQQTANSQSELA
jgi:disulfide bond formation protein DsbB